jgi:hypothetical protein
LSQVENIFPMVAAVAEDLIKSVFPGDHGPLAAADSPLSAAGGAISASSAPLSAAGGAFSASNALRSAERRAFSAAGGAISAERRAISASSAPPAAADAVKQAAATGGVASRAPGNSSLRGSSGGWSFASIGAAPPDRRPPPASRTRPPPPLETGEGKLESAPEGRATQESLCDLCAPLHLCVPLLRASAYPPRLRVYPPPNHAQKKGVAMTRTATP